MNLMQQPKTCFQCRGHIYPLHQPKRRWQSLFRDPWCMLQSNAIQCAAYFLVGLMRSKRNGDKTSCKQVYDPEQIFEQRHAR